MFFVALVIAIPELHPQTCHLDGNTLTMLAAGPAFAPLKWNVGQNNMGGYKGRLLFVPFDAPNTVPTVPDPGKAADNEALVTAVHLLFLQKGRISNLFIYIVQMQQSTIKRSSKVKLTGSAINKH